MTNVCIPMHLDAFALSRDTFDPKLRSRIAPYTQPNYTALRLDSHLLQRDVLDHTDFHNTQPAERNPRVANIGDDPPVSLKLRRMGIHLQWSLPRLYRTATASGRDETINQARGDQDRTQPIFKQIPNRWLVIRRLKNAKRPLGMSEFQCWVVESDSLQTIKSISPDVDLESDVSPFVSYDGRQDGDNVLNSQTENFIGQKHDLQNWPPANPSSPLPNGLTVMSSSNPLFADYALHNTNVLSIIDNFAYPRTSSDQNMLHDESSNYLSEALCDYFVIGWHNLDADDPLQRTGDTLKDRLDNFLLKLSPNLDPPGPESGDPSEIRNQTVANRCLLHSAIYDVKYTFQKPPLKPGEKDDPSKWPHSVVEECAAKFTEDVRMEPVSIGTTPLDGMLAFLEAHDDDDVADREELFGRAKNLPSSVVELSTLLFAASDSYDARVEAQDMIAQQNYSKTDGGTKWTFSVPSTKDGSLMLPSTGKPKIPTQIQIDMLKALNEIQTRRDSAERKRKSLRWELFAEWFKVKSEYIEQGSKLSRYRAYQDRVGPLKDQIRGINELVDHLDSQIQTKRTQVDCKAASNDSFRQRSDPTLCVAGIESGWPSDIMDKLQVRIDNPQVSELTTAKIDLDKVSTIFANAESTSPLKFPIPKDNRLQETAIRILGECLKASNASTSNGKDSAPTISGFQSWGDRNPFVPLFIEWESMYYHIDWSSWDVQLRPSPVGHAHSQLRYEPKDLLVSGDTAKDKVNADTNQNNFRVLTGRVLVLPQPRFNLEAVVLQVLDSKSSDIPDDLREDPRKPGTNATLNELKDNIRQIKFISAPLSGITNHLLTRCEGAHVRPNVRTPGQTVKALKAADASEIGLTVIDLPLIDGESALTPYGSLLPFGKDEYKHYPFKPVTHGQFMLTKLNIIDKFGQAICLPEMRRKEIKAPIFPATAAHPCLSDILTPSIMESADGKKQVLNTVFPIAAQTTPEGYPLCPLIELPPSINQDARINGAFLKKSLASSTWQEVSDYESPIWGWIVINYADNGLQFFFGNGTFYRELRRGGVHGTNLSKMLILEPPDSPARQISADDPVVKQMNDLIDLFTKIADSDASYLQAFANMINGAIQNMPFPPSSYAGYANAIIGKPLALVNAGWSIELAEPPIKPQFDPMLLPVDKAWVAEKTLLEYDFQIKIGDHQRNFDGVVGYFAQDLPLKKNSGVRDQNVNLTRLYTYFMPEKQPQGNNKFIEIVPGNFLTGIRPFYIDPETQTTPDMTAARNEKYCVTSLLIDPYTAIHAYSPILPTKKLQLPDWSIQAAMDKMHAFFQLGPLLVANDVPPTYEDANGLKEDGTSKASVRLPISGRKGTWSWLQPYEQDGFEDSGDTKGPALAAMDVEVDLGNIKFEPGPYTFLEGYLQLMGRLDNKGDAK